MARGDEAFVPLGSDKATRVGDREFVYADGGGRVICRLDLIQADLSKVTASTTDVMLIIEGTRWHARETFDAARIDLIDVIARYCGGEVETAVWPS
jgi:DNA/RNA-binding domain of Phe-tRNA-synthetase-like protein